MPQWLSLDEARDHFRLGASVWRWAGTNDGEDPEILLAASGDNLTLEVLAAAQLLREEVPDWRVRVVNVMDLLALGIPQKYPHGSRRHASSGSSRSIVRSSSTSTDTRRPSSSFAGSARATTDST
jgi:phosphoketolase